MALSVPVNGLKEGDKEPVIELFVKVRQAGGWVGPSRPVPSRRRARALRPLGAPSPNRRFSRSKFPSAAPLRRAEGATAASGTPPPPNPVPSPRFPPQPTRGATPPPPCWARGAPFRGGAGGRAGRRRQRGTLLRAAPGRAAGDAPSGGGGGGGAGPPRTKGPFGGEGSAGLSQCVQMEPGDNANRK